MERSLVIGLMIKQARKEAGLTQEELASRSGTSKHYISRIENNKSDIEMLTLKKIVEAGLGRKLKYGLINFRPSRVSDNIATGQTTHSYLTIQLVMNLRFVKTHFDNQIGNGIIDHIAPAAEVKIQIFPNFFVLLQIDLMHIAFVAFPVCFS